MTDARPLRRPPLRQRPHRRRTGADRPVRNRHRRSRVRPDEPPRDRQGRAVCPLLTEPEIAPAPARRRISCGCGAGRRRCRSGPSAGRRPLSARAGRLWGRFGRPARWSPCCRRGRVEHSHQDPPVGAPGQLPGTIDAIHRLHRPPGRHVAVLHPARRRRDRRTSDRRTARPSIARLRRTANCSR